MNRPPQISPRVPSANDRTGTTILSHFGQRLVELAELPIGARVLDAAAGRGAILFAAAARVGLNGAVIGIDQARLMRGTAAQIERAALSNAEIKQMDADDLQFPDETFDSVLCGFGLSSLQRPEQALQEFARVLKPGGCVALSTWSEDSPFLSWLREIASPHAMHPGREPDSSRRFETPTQLESALRNAGFENIRTTFEDHDFVYADEDAWWQSLSSDLWRPSDDLARSGVERLKKEMVAKVGFLKQPDGIHNPYRALFAAGCKPAR